MKRIKNPLMTLLVLSLVLSSVLNVYGEESAETESTLEDNSEYIEGMEEDEETEDIFIFEKEYIDKNIEEENVDRGKQPEDVQTEDVDMLSDLEEFNFLNQIGISIPDEKQDSVVMREKAAMYFSLLYGTDIASKKDITYFGDVSLQNEYLQYINSGCEHGYISGTEEGKFEPKRAVTLSEFVTVILRIGGYRDYIEAKGGTLLIYHAFAREYGLLKGLSLGFDEELTERDALKLMNNALDMPACDVKSVENNNLTYEINENYTLLERNFNIMKKRGIICAAEHAALPNYSSCDEKLVLISADDEECIYRCSDFDLNSLLGQRVDFYIDEDKNLIYAVSNKIENRVVLSSEDMTVSADRTEVVYTNESGKTKKIRLSYDTVFIYNGRQCNSLSVDEMNEKNTMTEFVDVDDDGVYEIAYVEHNNPMVAEAMPDMGISMGVQIDQYDSEYPLYPEELLFGTNVGETYRSFTVSERSTGKSVILSEGEDCELTLLKDGKRITYDDIRINDLLSVCESKDGKIKKVYVSRNIDEDYIKSVNNTERIIETAGGKKYKYTFDIGDTPILGKSVVLYIDVYGYAAAYRFSNNTEILQYGYLINCANVGSSIAGELKAKIYNTVDKRIEVLSFADKFTHNGEKCKDDELEAYFSETGHQLIKYSLDTERKIKQIYTSAVPEGYNLKGEKPIFVLNEHYNGGGDKYGFYKNSMMEQEYNLETAERLLVITDDDGNVVDDRIYTVSSFLKDKTHDLRVYDAKTGKIASFLVCTIKEKDIESYMAFSRFYFVIEGFRYDTKGKYMTGMSSTYRYNFYESEPGMFNDLKPGDIVKIKWFELDEDGNYEVLNYDKIFTLEAVGNEDAAKTLCADASYSSSDKPLLINTTAIGSYILYGTVFAMESLAAKENVEDKIYSVVVQLAGTTSPEDFYVFPFSRFGNCPTRIVKYDTAGGTLENVLGYTLKSGDTIFAATYGFDSEFVVIYE